MRKVYLMLIVGLLAATMAAAAGQAYAKKTDYCDGILGDWRADRDRAVMTTLHLWMDGSANDAIRPHVRKLVDTEVNMMACFDDPSEAEALYTTNIKNAGLDTFPVLLFEEYLRRNSGITLDPRQFFEGRTFLMTDYSQVEAGDY